jgi:hypothetical protein
MLSGIRVVEAAGYDDFAVDEKNPSTYYIGYAVSGLWKTVNNGTTFTPIFSTYGHSIANIALAPSDPDILVAGTLDGVYRSRDASKSWERISPEHPDELRVDLLAGALFGGFRHEAHDRALGSRRAGWSAGRQATHRRHRAWLPPRGVARPGPGTVPGPHRR